MDESTPCVLNYKRDGLPPGAVYIGRLMPRYGLPWHNPYKVGHDGTRAEFVRKHFSVELYDGNGDKFLFFSMSPIGPVATGPRGGPVTEEEWCEVEQALVAALEFWRGKPFGGKPLAKVLPFNPGPA